MPSALAVSVWILETGSRWAAGRLLAAYVGSSHTVAVGAGARPWNRTSRDVEERLVRLHVAQPLLGTGALRHLAARVAENPHPQPAPHRRVAAGAASTAAADFGEAGRPAMGIDFTLVWVLGFFPLWVLGVVDHHVHPDADPVDRSVLLF